MEECDLAKVASQVRLGPMHGLLLKSIIGVWVNSIIWATWEGFATMRTCGGFFVSRKQLQHTFIFDGIVKTMVP